MRKRCGYEKTGLWDEWPVEVISSKERSGRLNCTDDFLRIQNRKIRSSILQLSSSSPKIWQNRNNLVVFNEFELENYYQFTSNWNFIFLTMWRPSDEVVLGILVLISWLFLHLMLSMWPNICLRILNYTFTKNVWNEVIKPIMMKEILHFYGESILKQSC